MANVGSQCSVLQNQCFFKKSAVDTGIKVYYQ
jgi:hypothetical protein